MAEKGLGKGDKTDNMFSSEQNQGLVPTSDGPLTSERDTVLQQAAASTLLQLHDRDLPNIACGDNENLTNDTPHFGTRRLNGVNTNRPYISGSWENLAYGRRNVAQPP